MLRVIHSSKMCFFTSQKYRIVSCVLLTFIFAPKNECNGEEICSKFHYEEQLLEKMIKLEFNVQLMLTDIKDTKKHVDETIENMEKKMDDFAEAHQKLSDSVSQTLNQKQTDIENFQEELKNETNTYMTENIESRMDLKVKEIEDFKTKSDDDMKKIKLDLETEIEAKKTELDAFKAEATAELEDFKNNVTDRVDDKIKHIEKLEVKIGSPTVAFNVYSPADLSVGTGEIIVFQNEVINKGKAYSSSDGKFTAPFAGLYYFSAHVCAVAGKFVHYGIYIDGKPIAVSSQREDTDSSCGSVSTVAMVEDGGKVWVQILVGTSSENQLSQDDYRWNSFVGALLN